MLELTSAQRKRTVWRLDGVACEHIRWLLARGYHFLTKGTSGHRAAALARQVRRWDAYGDAWLGEAAPPVDYGRPCPHVRQTESERRTLSTMPPVFRHSPCPPRATSWLAITAAAVPRWDNFAETKAVWGWQHAVNTASGPGRIHPAHRPGAQPAGRLPAPGAGSARGLRATA